MGWIKRAIGRRVTNTWGKQIEEFITLLSYMDGDEVAFILVIATDLRVQAYRNSGYDLLVPAACIAKHQLIASEMVLLAKEYQASDVLRVLVSGLGVWIHTLRAVQWLPIRPHGRRMWRELMRGVPYIEEGVESFVNIMGVMPGTDGIECVPEGFTPEPT